MSAPDRSSRLLAELVRLLHERSHVFAIDPEVLDRALAQSAEPPEARIVQRARMLDRDGALAAALARTEQRAHLLHALLTALAAFGGFTAAAALMQQSGLNFFLVLVGVLGMNTLMLVLWLAAAYGLRRRSAVLSPPAWLVRGSRFQEALLALYTAEWQQPAARWQAGALSHRFWSASLAGMSAAVLLFLSVRQYTFNWESTLLSDHSLVQLVGALAWLPERLGFPVPDTQAVLNSRLQHHTASAHQWGGLLLGSLLCYGLLPRLLAWGICVLLARSRPAGLPLALPYYRQLLRGWQRRIVDADDYQADAVPVLPPLLSAGSEAEAWAVMLERPWPDAAWYRHVLGRSWQDYGVADSRDSVATLLDDLARRPVQLLLGIRAASLPDRGLLRQIDRLAQAAQGGVVVQLLAAESEHDVLSEAVPQWQAALQARGLPVLLPPHLSQQGFR